MFKNVLKLFSGNALAQAIQLLALVYLANLYLPDDFGKLGKIQSFGAILSILITLQMQHVIPLTKGVEIAKDTTRVIINLALVNFFLSLLLLLFLEMEYGYAIFLSLILGLINTINGYMVYKGEFSQLSILYVLRAISIVTLQFIFYFIKIPDGLLYGAILGEVAALVYLAYHKAELIKIKFDLKKIKQTIVEWKSFSLHGTIQELLSVAIYALPMIFYVEKFGENVGGQYSIAYKVIFAPTVLISSSLAQVLYHRFNTPEGFHFLNKTFWFDKRILLLIPVILIPLFLIPNFELPYLEHKWDVTITILPYLFVNALFFLFANPYRVALRALKLNKRLIKIELLTLFLMTLLFLFLELSVLQFTMYITIIGVIQNILIVIDYRTNQRMLNKLVD